MAALFPRAVVAGFAGILALGGCSAYDGGYGGVSVGAGYYGASRYYDPWYDGHYGWYDGFYYPGSGYYVFDRRGQRHRWREHHRRYWEGRRAERRDDRHEGRDGRRNERRDWSNTRRDDRRDRRVERPARQHENVSGPTRTRQEALRQNAQPRVQERGSVAREPRAVARESRGESRSRATLRDNPRRDRD